ncbi:hypothetical protein CEXT_634501 [Caerostris extrusa]|uniref:Transposase n=1 Tax=Caerostris extrusa TaxID=172846 RepID=A0AAV4R8C2_CAEEX|nr:hypothetical protein CEXT_634501 [Caerostris extrusa]
MNWPPSRLGSQPLIYIYMAVISPGESSGNKSFKQFRKQLPVSWSSVLCESGYFNAKFLAGVLLFYDWRVSVNGEFV